MQYTLKIGSTSRKGRIGRSSWVKAQGVLHMAATVAGFEKPLGQHLIDYFPFLLHKRDHKCFSHLAGTSLLVF